MTVLEKAGALLPEMTDQEKAQLLQWVASELSGIYPGIEKTPGVCGGDACITRTRIPVWSLVNSKKMGLTDAQLLEAYPTLTEDDLRNAWNYYRGNRAEIEAQIFENEDF
jgi:uncharacterized protein (DUF433 family)